MDKHFRHIAALDLGSNSFHMIVADVDQDQFTTVDKLKEMVRLAAGLDNKKKLTEESMDRAIACLERFGQRLREFPPSNVRIVGTNTLRKARNSQTFISQAEQALGHTIDIIGGHEEARLIYLGVSHSLEDGSEQRLVVDIGGGSTEFILGQHFKPQHMESLHMGCVAMSNQFFHDGVITERRMARAELAAYRELQAIDTIYKGIGWESAIGASGTILAIRDVVHAKGWCKDGISASSLRKLRKALISASHVDALEFEGLHKERTPVFPGGCAVLSAIINAFGIDNLRVSKGALREGLLYDLLGRIHHEDVRERTVTNLTERYGINKAQAERVNQTTLHLYGQIATAWQIDGKEMKSMLRWACHLHEIGMTLSHSQYHKHGGYLLRNLDMPGFARGEQRILASIVRGHRRKFPNKEFKALPKSRYETARRLCVLLRLSVLLHRSHSGKSPTAVSLDAQGSKLTLHFASGWLDDHPLTQADLEQEATYFEAADLSLSFR